MQMPEPTEAHARFESMAGHWVGDESMPDSPMVPGGVEARGVTHATVALGGFALICEYHQEKDGQRTFEGHGIYTYDQNAKEYVLDWYDSMGGRREEFRGSFDGDTLVMSSEGPMGKMRSTTKYDADGTMHSRMEMSMDGSSWGNFMEGTYRREA